MPWLALHLHRLPLEIFTRGAPERRPGITVDGQRVLLGNAEAEAAGIEPGMSLATARALVADLGAVQRNRERELAVINQLAQWALRFTPGVVIRPPATLLLEVGPVLRLFHGLGALQQSIEADLQNMGFSVHQGLAATPAAAWLMAHSAPASRPAWFDYATDTLDRAALRRALAATPLACLDVDSRLIERLQKPGFTTLGDLLALPLHAVGRRFGKPFLLYLSKLQGLALDPQPFVTPESRYRREIDFIDAVANHQALLFPMRRLLDELAGFLTLRQLDCPGLQWLLVDDAGERHSLPIFFSRPLHQPATILELTRVRLESLRLKRPVTTLALQCDRFSARTAHSDSLFAEPLAQRRNAFTEVVDKLRARLDANRLYRPARIDRHVPEQAGATLPVGTGESRDEQPPAAVAQPRPTWLWRRPVPLRRTREGLFHGGKLTLLEGPERIESDWWQQPVERDYFIARHENGGVYWVFHDRRCDRWYVHGLFA